MSVCSTTFPFCTIVNIVILSYGVIYQVDSAECIQPVKLEIGNSVPTKDLVKVRNRESRGIEPILIRDP